MVHPGDVVFLACKSKTDTRVRIRGTAVEVEGGNVTVAFSAELASAIQNAAVYEKEGETALGFIKVPAEATSSAVPAGWGSKVGGKAPSFEASLAAWDSLSRQVGLESSEAEVVAEEVHGKKTKKSNAEGPLKASLEAELMKMGQEMWDVSEEDESSSEDGSPGAAASSKHLAPGARSRRSKKKDKKREKAEKGDLFQEVLLKGMSSGQSPADLMPMAMMAFMMNQQQAKRREGKSRRSRDSSLGGSSSESSSGDSSDHEAGMKAVTTLHRLHRRIRRRPKKIIHEFEKSLRAEMGVIEGQPWSVKDWLKRQPWGKFKGLYRASVMDAEAYELARAGDASGCAAQLAQNMKSKLQSVLQQGDWETAWLLTGIDPLTRKEWAGSKSEMAVISNYISSLHKLRKKVKEAKDSKDEENE